MQELEDITIGHYHIERQLARGGMSEIYLAKDLTSDQTVAIKMVHCSNNEYYERFRQEMYIMSSLRHEHILPVLDHGEYETWYYLVVPYISSGTLSEHLLLGELSVQEAGDILEQLTDALQFAHEQGIVHRDLKPSNVLLRDRKHVYLADFGLAKRVGENRGFTVTGIMMGTPEYIAPELAEEPASVRSDIYALGILLYQMLTGKVPFSASTPLAIFLKHVSEEPQRPSVHNTSIPLSVEKVILRALEKDPNRRYRTAADMMNAYRRAMAVETSHLYVLEERDTLDIPVYVKHREQSLSKAGEKQKLYTRAFTSLVAGGVACLLLLFLSLNFTFYQELPQPTSTSPKVEPVSTQTVIPHTNPQRTPTETNNQNANSEGAQIFGNGQSSTSKQEGEQEGHDHDGKGDQNEKGKGHGKH